MTLTQTAIPGLLIIAPQVFGDARGFFMESWHRKRYQETIPELAGYDFVQDNFSRSRQGILRGLHCQNPAAQGKLVSVLEGEVFDVAVDLRRESPTFGQWHGLNLSAGNHLQFFIPPGFAHGFAVLSDSALFHYKCTDYYAPQHELAIRWDDPDIGIQWPIREPLLSARDAAAPLLRDVPKEKLF